MGGGRIGTECGGGSLEKLDCKREMEAAEDRRETWSAGKAVRLLLLLMLRCQGGT